MFKLSMKNKLFEKEVKVSKKKILLIFTGGTISMIHDKNTKALIPAETLEDLFVSEPELKKIADLEFLNLFNIDSSDIEPDHWHTIAKKIVDEYENFDGFVIAHGTDTMAYTSSALSFLLKDLGKPVIITGSQYPLSGGMRTDARINLFNSILFAQDDIGEVAICFGSNLIRGNRSTKLDAVKLDAFSSPNFEKLGFIGAKIVLNPHRLHRSKKKVKIEGKLNHNVMLIKMTPGINPEVLEIIPKSIQGVVIEGFGSGGNIPQKLLSELKKKIVEDGLLVALKSQCLIGNIDLSIYEGGSYAEKMGVFHCGDMTSEAAFCKLSWLLGQSLSKDEIKEKFESNLRGEMTEE